MTCIETKKFQKVCNCLLGQKVQKLATKYTLEKLWWKSIAVQENKIIAYGTKVFSGFQLFSKGHLWSCTPLKELSQKLCESVYMPWFQLCYLDMLKTTSHSLMLTFHQKVVLITTVQSNHYFAGEFWQCAKAIKADLPIPLWSIYCKKP